MSWTLTPKSFDFSTADIDFDKVACTGLVCNRLQKEIRGAGQVTGGGIVTGGVEADFVIAGAGHNSLVTACYLAAAGQSCVDS